MRAILAASAALLFAAVCAAGPSEDDVRRRADEILRASFTRGDQKIAARVMRQDEVQELCSKHRNAPPPEVAERIEKSQQAAIRYPAGGRLLGDWRKGEKIAQDGYGLRFTDPEGKR